MSEERQICNSSVMDTGAENMDEISISPAVPFDDDDDDELMRCDDILDNKDVTYLCIPEDISEDEISTYSADWYADTDSDTSEVISLFDQNVDDEITKVCQSFLFLENLETALADEFEDKEAIIKVIDQAVKTLQSTEAVFEEEKEFQVIRAEESTRPASSSSTNTDITKAAEMLVLGVIDKAVEILQSSQNEKIMEGSEAVTTLQFSEDVHIPEDTETVIALQSSETVKTPEATEALTEYCSVTEDNTRSGLDSSTTQTLCDVVDSDTPVKISPSFTEEIVGEVTDEVEAVKTPQSERKESQRRASGCRRVKIHPAPLTRLDEAVSSVSTNLTSKSSTESMLCKFKNSVSPLPSTSISPNHEAAQPKCPMNLFLAKMNVDGFQKDSECLRTNPAPVGDIKTKISCFVSFFQNIFSKVAARRN